MKTRKGKLNEWCCEAKANGQPHTCQPNLETCPHGVITASCPTCKPQPLHTPTPKEGCYVHEKYNAYCPACPTPTPYDGLMQIFLDGIEASTDGRGWNNAHQQANDYMRRAVNSHIELLNILGMAEATIKRLDPDSSSSKGTLDCIKQAIAKAEGA